MHRFYCLAGRAGYIISLPLLRRLFAPTNRAYVLLQCGDEVLVVKNWLSRQQWQLPGGGLRAGEDARKAVVRELREELGVEYDGWLRTISQGVWQTDRLDYKYEFFAASLPEKPSIARARLELIAAGWLKLGGLSPANTNPEVLNAVSSYRSAAAKG